MYPNIVLTAKCGSGKTTIANHLVSNYMYTKVSFADALKKLATDACGMKEKDRGLLQRLGVGIRLIDENFWVNAAFKKISKINGPVVIDDLRFENEYTKAVEQGFQVFKVVRNREDRIRSFGLNPEQVCDFESHISETALDHIQLPEIDANCDIQQLYKTIDNLMQDLSEVYSKK